jgi:hypothetical protein
MVTEENKPARKTNSDLWFYSLSLVNCFVFLLSAVAVTLRIQSSEVKVPIRLVAGNEFVQGNWWNTYLVLGVVFGLLIMAFIYSSRLKKLDPVYRNGVLLFGLILQIFAFATLYRVAGLSTLV